MLDTHSRYMARRSNKSIDEILTPPLRSQVHIAAIYGSSPRNNDSDDLLLLVYVYYSFLYIGSNLTQHFIHHNRT
jgi:hypothetical protein